jgi:hypothetical protein
MLFAKKERARMVAIAKSKPEEGRDALRHAQSSLAAAEELDPAARAATNRARALVEEITRQLEDLEAASVRVASSLATEMKAAIAAGGTPSVATNDREKAKNDVARTALDARLQAAEQVVGDFLAEEREREREASNAKDAVERAIQDVMRGEVETIAARWAEVELEARALRIKLGREGDPVWRLSGLCDAGLRATGQNYQDVDFDFRERQITSGPWIEFSASLREDSDARLDFTAADRAIEEMRKERAERREANERFALRMRGEAA